MDLSTEKRHFWQQHAEQAQLHKGSLADYAKQHQLKASALYYWAGIFKRAVQSNKLATEPVSFSAVRVSPPATAAHYQLHLSSRLTLQCPVLPDPRWLAELSRQLDTLA